MVINQFTFLLDKKGKYPAELASQSQMKNKDLNWNIYFLYLLRKKHPESLFKIS